jgi:hypothetical protein
MSTRIHKVMGYGLTDVAHEGHRITDSRINTESFLLDRSLEEVELSFDQWLAERYPGNLDAAVERQALKSNESSEAHKAVTWEGEFGLPNVLVVRPASEPRWHRYDDPIDYQEEAIRGKFTDYRVESTIGGIHPYEGLWMDAWTGEQITGKQADVVRVWRRLVNEPLKDGVTEADRAAVLDKVAQGLGFGLADHAEAEQLIVPLVPDVIRWVCEWGELFTSPDVWRQLRPVLYTYHS